MKKLLLVLAVLLLIIVPFCCSFAQGPQTLVTVPRDGAGNTAQGWLYLPADYSTSGKAYPVVFFYHGIGEAGTNPYTVLNQGVPQLIAGGMRPDNILNPVDGQRYSFIVLSLQDQSWSPDPQWLPFEISWLKQRYRIDESRLYVTGLSAGGASTLGACVYNSTVSGPVAAAVIMSPAWIQSSVQDFTLIAKNKLRTWFICSDPDPVVGTAPTNAYYAEFNRQYPGSSHVTWYSSGHCCWNTYYDLNYKDPALGVSIWQFLLQSAKPAKTLPIVFISLKLLKK